MSAQLVLLASTLWGSFASELNPFERGCLREQLPHTFSELRVCNSDDPPDAESRGVCRKDELSQEYLELRIFTENWESVFFESWILQIILSELLGVPTTVETGTPDARLNFYDPDAPFEYGTTDDVDSIRFATEVIDCRLVSRDKPNYQSCAHMSPEIWKSESKAVQDGVTDGSLEIPQGLGIVGQDTWYMTKFTAVQDPSLDSYLGLQGEENRKKLAETFLRPTTWKDYCDLVSNSNCSVPDKVAARAPLHSEEDSRMFVDGLYTGHFRATEKNNCVNNSDTCTGHVADYPCDWTSFVGAQTHHLKIALESNGNETGSGGYTYSQLVDMWYAANATKSNLMTRWWMPNPQYSKFLGTEAEFHRVNFPPPTKECIAARISLDARCSDDFDERVGDPAGVCDNQAQSLDKLISGTLFEAIYDPDIPEALRSPGYDVFRLFKMSEFQLNEICSYWQTEPSARHALCRWASENVDYLRRFVRSSYPRVVEENHDDPMLYATLILGGLATGLVAVMGMVVYRKRDKRAIRYAQLEFLRLLLAGSFLIAVGAIVSGLPPTSGSCVALIWLINIGYTLELVPLIVKVAAINSMMIAARKMRRKTVNVKQLLRAVMAITVVMIIFLILWSVLDTPSKQAEYWLSGSVTADGSTVVEVSFYCSSQSDIWQYVAVGWNAVLLLCATVLAMQTRKIQEDFNESRTLAFLIYSHFVFVILRLTTLFLSGEVREGILSGVRSIIFSVDTSATILIYFLPKLTAIEKKTVTFKQKVLRRISMGTPRLRDPPAFSSDPPDFSSYPPDFSSCACPPVTSEISANAASHGGLTVNSVAVERSAPLSGQIPENVAGARCPHCGHFENKQFLEKSTHEELRDKREQ